MPYKSLSLNRATVSFQRKPAKSDKSQHFLLIFITSLPLSAR
jgi:hypothetical protein